MDIEGFCANCGEKIYLHPVGIWRHEFRNFLFCAAEDDAPPDKHHPTPTSPIAVHDRQLAI